jgi:signal transduction histidine kinase/ActR/RegA family two-component response regulator
MNLRNAVNWLVSRKQTAGEHENPNRSGRRTQNFIDRLLLPLAIGLGAVVVVLGIYQWLLVQQQTKVQSVANSELSFIKNKIEFEVVSRIAILQHLAQPRDIKKPPDSEEWESNAALVMSASQGLNAIVWIDRDFRVLRVAMRRESDAKLVFDFRSDVRSRAVLESAARQLTTLASHSIQLNDDQNGFLVCVPIVSNESFQGALVAIYSYQELLGPILNDAARDDFVSIYDGQQRIYSRLESSKPSLGITPLVADVSVGQLTWQAQVSPKPETLVRAQSILPELILVAGLQMSALLAFTVYSVERARARARELTAAHEQLRDQIAEREKIEEDLRHAHKMEAVGQLAGGVAHSFNNLLLIIRGHAELLLKCVTFGESLERHPKEILKATERASTLTRQLLAFSRKQILEPKVLDLNILLSQTAVLLPPLLGPDIKLMLSLAPDLGQVKADPGQIEQIVMNLVVNARDAMPFGGQLKIETANVEYDETVEQPGLPKKGVALSVKDNGCGMDEQTRERIFEPFFSTKETGRGTGLGLSMVYGTVEQSGGSIKVISEPGRGTKIQICLPCVESEKPAAIAQPAQPSEVPASGTAETVLLVDDEDGIRHVAREFLKIKGYNVLEAREATEAIRIAERHAGPIHVMLTDIVMPGIKGEQLAGQVSALRPEVKILYMSAYTEDAVLNLGILAPGTNFIEKPFGPDELARKIRAILQGKQTKHSEPTAGQIT